MEINGAVALVTGANRGLGAAFAQALLDNGAAKVYAGARDPESVSDRRLTPLRLDVTDQESVERAAAVAGDVSILVNNAGVATTAKILDDESALRTVLDVNLFGLVAVSRAFAPVLGANGGGALVNMLSVASWRHGLLQMYGVSKAAAWAASNALRVQLAAQGTLVVNVHVGVVDTDMSAAFDVPKVTARSVADAAMEGIRRDASEVYGDDHSRDVKAKLSGSIDEMYSDFLTTR